MLSKHALVRSPRSVACSVVGPAASACPYDLAPVRTSGGVIIITIIVPCVRATACVNDIRRGDDILSADL
jgi:hypothetical protein